MHVNICFLHVYIIFPVYCSIFFQRFAYCFYRCLSFSQSLFILLIHCKCNFFCVLLAFSWQNHHVLWLFKFQLSLCFNSWISSLSWWCVSHHDIRLSSWSLYWDKYGSNPWPHEHISTKHNTIAIQHNTTQQNTTQLNTTGWYFFLQIIDSSRYARLSHTWIVYQLHWGGERSDLKVWWRFQNQTLHDGVSHLRGHAR